jgi:hypothetical protein
MNTLSKSYASIFSRKWNRKVVSKFSTETTKMNLFTAVNDAMRVAMTTDQSAIVFGEVN